MSLSQQEKGEAFRALHQGEPFVIPNPWDAGSRQDPRWARLQGARHHQRRLRVHPRPAATARSPSTRSLAHVTALERGDRPAGLGRPRERLRPGARGRRAGDHPRRRGRSRRRLDRGLRPRRRASSTSSSAPPSGSRPPPRPPSALDFPFTLTARAENHLRGNPDLDDTIARLRAYEEAGADVLYAPGAAHRRRDQDGLRRGLEAGQRARLRPARPRPRPRSPRPARSASASAAGSPGRPRTALIEAAERIIDDGDFSGTATPGRVKEWL